jgi:uncharacterized protein YdeI (YjbR/CyaY-like superfamily)
MVAKVYAAPVEERVVKTESRTYSSSHQRKPNDPSGLAEVEAAKRDGRWDTAYDPSSTMEVPEDFLKELKKDKAAYAFFKTLNRANTYAIAWRLKTAKKPETRARRMQMLLAMMRQGKTLHQQR